MDNEKPPRLLEVVSGSGRGSDLSDGDDADADALLNAVELRFIELVASGQSLADTGAQIGRSERTARRWMKRPEMAAAVKARASEQVQTARSILTSGMSRAARSLVDMSDGKADAVSPKVQAAKAVLDAATALTTVGDLQERLTELETKLAGTKKQGGAAR